MRNIISFEEHKNKMIQEGKNDLEKAFDFNTMMRHLTGIKEDEDAIAEIIQMQKELDAMLPNLSKEEEYKILNIKY